MWDQHSVSEPTVFRLEQQRGPVVESSLRRSERDWPLTLEDCQAALSRLLPQVKSAQTSAEEYWRWVSRTRTEMCRLFESHRQSSRARQEWDLPGLLRLRCRVELITLRLYCAPWMPNGVQVPALSLSLFSRLTA